jgi:hypothetical protein
MITLRLPDFGQDSCVPATAIARSCIVAMPHRDLVDHLTRTTALSLGEAARVIDDVLAYFAEPAAAYVRRRHTELRGRGLTNDEIFYRIAAELPARRVAPPELSLRQLRRIVYG